MGRDKGRKIYTEKQIDKLTKNNDHKRLEAQKQIIHGVVNIGIIFGFIAVIIFISYAIAIAFMQGDNTYIDYVYSAGEYIAGAFTGLGIKLLKNTKVV